jgi:cell division initiation protein
MKVTPLDLRQTHLSTSLRGFDRDEVRTLLTDAADDYEAALREVDRLRQDLQKAESQLGEHRDREINLRNTLLTAQKVADQIRENAGKEAEVLLRDADTRSTAMLKDAELRSTTLTCEAEARTQSLVSTAEVRSLALTTDAETRAATVTREADARADATIREADARADATLREATARSQATLAEADSRAQALITDAQLRADATYNEAQLRADAMLKDAQGRVDLLLQKANARLDELEHAVSEMRLRKRDVEGTLEQSIASLTYALEFVRTQDARDDKVRMLRPRTSEQGIDTQRNQGGEAAMLG